MAGPKVLEGPTVTAHCVADLGGIVPLLAAYSSTANSRALAN